MKKIILVSLVSLVSLLIVTAAYAQNAPKIKIGINAEITGDIPKVGDSTKRAAQMWAEEVNKADGIEAGGKKHPVEIVIEDDEAKADSAAKAAAELIIVDEVIAIVSAPGLPAGHCGWRGLQQPEAPHDQRLDYQSRHHQEPSLRFSVLLPG